MNGVKMQQFSRISDFSGGGTKAVRFLENDKKSVGQRLF